MLGPPKLRCLDQPIAVSLEELVPGDHFYRYLDAKLDLSFVRTWVQDCYAEGGRPSIDPVVFFKLQLIMFFEGLRSERKLIETASLHLAHRWYLGYGLNEALPDHSSLTRIRTRLGLPLFQRFFEYVVALCQAAGLVWGKELVFDATKVQANAALDSLVPRWYAEAKAHLGALFDDPSDDELPAARAAAARPENTPAAAGPTALACLPFSGTADAQQQLAAANAGRWQLLEERRLNPQRPGSGHYQRTSDLKVSTTDPDAAPMRKRGEATRLGYHDHYVVDGGKARVILAALVTPADVMENQAMLDLLWWVRFRWQLHPKRAIGDTTYGTIDTIRALEDAGIRAYVPLPDWDKRTPFYGLAHFTYHAAQDAFRCPQGHPLRRHSAHYDTEVISYRAEAAVCNACPVKAACTTSNHGRLVHRSFHADYLDRVRDYHATAAYAKAMRKRQVWVEPLFGEAKDWHGLRRFRLRGLWRVNCVGLLVAAGQNLKRWLTKTGWGRRHGPGGSLALAHGAQLTGS
jgi:transposase